MSSGDKAAHRGGHAAEVVGASVPDADEEAARRLRKVYANRASAARSKERKKATTTLEQQVRMLEQQTTAQATEIFGLKAANHALRGQNSAQAQQLLLLRQQMRVFEEQLPRALQGPCIGHQEHLSVQQASRGHSVATMTPAGSPSPSMHSSGSTVQPQPMSLMRSQHSQETTAVSEQGGTLAAPIIRSHANDPATGIGASRGRPEQSGGSMPIITVAAGGHVFVEAGGLVSNHRLPFRQPCEAMPSEAALGLWQSSRMQPGAEQLQPIGLPIPGPMQRTQSLMLATCFELPAAEAGPATALARLTPQQQRQLQGVALQSQPSRELHVVESHQTMRIHSAPAQVHPRVEGVDQWLGLHQAAGSPTPGGLAAYGQQLPPAAPPHNDEVTGVELEALASAEPASFLDMADSVPGADWCMEGSIFEGF